MVAAAACTKIQFKKAHAAEVSQVWQPGYCLLVPLLLQCGWWVGILKSGVKSGQGRYVVYGRMANLGRKPLEYS